MLGLLMVWCLVVGGFDGLFCFIDAGLGLIVCLWFVVVCLF